MSNFSSNMDILRFLFFFPFHFTLYLVITKPIQMKFGKKKICIESTNLMSLVVLYFVEEL